MQIKTINGQNQIKNNKNKNTKTNKTTNTNKNILKHGEIQTKTLKMKKYKQKTPIVNFWPGITEV